MGNGNPTSVCVYVDGKRKCNSSQQILSTGNVKPALKLNLLGIDYRNK